LVDEDDDNDGILDVDEPFYIGPIHVAYLILAAILVIMIIVLLIIYKRKRTTAQTYTSQGVPAQHPFLQPQLIKCPSCDYRFEVFDEGRPLKIHCPSCGMEGLLEE